MLSLEEMKANRRKWVEALRSGKYKQTTQVLHDGEGYCCLGVLACVAGKTPDQLGIEETLVHFPDVMKFVGLSDDNAPYLTRRADPDDLDDYDETDCLADINDAGKSFAEIADIIESEPPGLFVESV